MEKFGVLELLDSVVVEHVWRKLVLLAKDDLELLDEFYLHTVVIRNESEDGCVARLRRELGFIWIEWVTPRRVLVAVLRVEELRVAPIEVVDGICLRYVGEVKELEQVCRLLSNRVEVQSVLHSHGVLC